MRAVCEKDVEVFARVKQRKQFSMASGTIHLVQQAQKDVGHELEAFICQLLFMKTATDAADSRSTVNKSGDNKFKYVQVWTQGIKLPII